MGVGHETHREYSGEGSTFVMRVLRCFRRLGKVQLPRRAIAGCSDWGSQKFQVQVWVTMWGHTRSRSTSSCGFQAKKEQGYGWQRGETLAVVKQL